MQNLIRNYLYEVQNTRKAFLKFYRKNDWVLISFGNYFFIDEVKSRLKKKNSCEKVINNVLNT